MKHLLAAGVGMLFATSVMAQTPLGTGPANPTTTVPEHIAISDAQIKQRLEAQGYSNVVIRDHKAGMADVTAMKNGQTHKMSVDTSTGKAMPVE